MTSELASKGFVVVPQVLSTLEVATLRDQIEAVLDLQGIDKAGGTVLPNAASEAPDLAWIFCHDRIIAEVRRATGMDEMMFTMEADLHRNYLASKWHKDTGEQMMEDGYFGCDAIGSADCRVYKVALYLQDHVGDSGSLHVRPGSISTSRLDIGEVHPISVRSGDAIVFDVRITHRGVSPGALDRALLGAAKAISPHHPAPLAAKLRRKRMRIEHKPNRIAVYFAFGLPNDKSEQFARRNMQRQLSQLGKTGATLPDALIASFGDQRIKTVAL